MGRVDSVNGWREGEMRGAQVRAHAVFALVVLGRDAVSLLDRTAHLRRGARLACIAYIRGRVGACESRTQGGASRQARYKLGGYMTCAVASRRVGALRVGSRRACLQRGA